MAVALALPPGARILDVGCGPGWLCEYFARLGYQVTGIDISPDLIEMARERLSKLPYGADQETGLSYRFIVHDVELGPLEETFDAIICYDACITSKTSRRSFATSAAMLAYGGQLFVLEGELPPPGSATEAELLTEMQEHETLESPFSREYLLTLLREHGFAVVGDFVSVNGLFDRETLEDNRLALTEPVAFNYLLCKKVSETKAEMRDSRNPGVLRAKITLRDEEAGSSLGPRAARPLSAATLNSETTSPLTIQPGAIIHLPIEIENTGDTLWLVSRAAPKGTVRIGVKTLNDAGEVIDEVHGSPPLPRAIAPRETVRLVSETRGSSDSRPLHDSRSIWFVRTSAGSSSRDRRHCR